MNRSILVDEEVWRWLQSQAEPLEDTPNSVLRRLAGLPAPAEVTAATRRSERSSSVGGAAGAARGNSGGPTANHRYSAAELAKKWGVKVSHALYHKDGIWYNNLERFPGALFDPNGYVIFEDERAYRSSPHVRVTRQTNVRGGISSLPGYVRAG